MFGSTEGAFIPFSLTPILELQKSGGSIMCMRDPESDGFASFLESECSWIHHWVKLPTLKDRDAYLDMLTNYSMEHSGRVLYGNVESRNMLAKGGAIKGLEVFY